MPKQLHDKTQEEGKMRLPGVEPGSQAWEACMIPLHYMRVTMVSEQKTFNSFWHRLPGTSAFGLVWGHSLALNERGLK